MKDLFFFCKAFYGISDLSVHNYVSIVTHNRSRLTLNPNLMLKTPLCITPLHTSELLFQQDCKIMEQWQCLQSSSSKYFLYYSSVKTF
jgi:hypothetical protein